MTSSATGRTWDNADAPSVTRAARLFDAAWRNAIKNGGKTLPDPRRFLDPNTPDLPAALLALLRAELAARFALGPREPLEGIFDRYPELNGEARVGLIYEEYCLREEAGEAPEIDEYLDRFPNEADSLRRVLEIHDWVGSAPSPSILKDLGSASLGSTLQNLAPTKPVFPEAGQKIGEFDLIEELGRGSFARVFLARDSTLGGRPVAVKVARTASAEPVTLARLQHTHIVPLYSHKTDEDSGLHMLCMPYYGRVTLSRLLAQAGAKSAATGAELLRVLDQLQPTEGDHAIGQRESEARQALRRLTFPQAIAWWAARLAEGLQHAHDRGILHRDVKPSNVLVTRDGTPMLLDFNLAENMTLDESAFSHAKLGGTLLYMAPEHLEGLMINDAKGVDGRADIFSLGVVLFEALTGQRPFDVPRQDGPMIESIAAAARERRLPPPSPRARIPETPATLDAIVRKCLSPNVEDRYARPADLAHDLQAFLDDEPLRHTSLRPSLRMASIIRRNRIRIAAAIPIVIALGAILAAERKTKITGEREKYEAVSLLVDAQSAENNGQYEQAARMYLAIARRNELDSELDKLGGDPQPMKPDGRRHNVLSEYERRTSNPISLIRGDAYKAAERNTANATIIKATQDFFEQAQEIRFALLGLDINKVEKNGLDALDLALSNLGVNREKGEWKDQRIVFDTLRKWDTSRMDTDQLAKAISAKPRYKGETPTVGLLVEEMQELIYLRILAEHTLFTNHSLPRLLKLCRLGQDLPTISKLNPSPSPWEALRAHLLKEAGPELEWEGDPVARGLWGQLLRTQHQDILALAMFQRAVALDPARVWTQLSLADLYLSTGSWNEARRHYDVAIVLAPESPWPYLGRANYAMRVGDTALAWSDAFIANYWTGDEPNDSYVRNLATFCLANAQRARGSLAEAESKFNLVVTHVRADFLKQMARLNLANIATVRQDFDGATKLLDQLIEELKPTIKDRLSGQPDAPNTDRQLIPESSLRERAELRLRMENGAGAVEDCNTGLELLKQQGPSSSQQQAAQLRADFLSIRAAARLILGDLEPARKDIEGAIEIREMPEHRRLLDRILVAQGKPIELSRIKPADVRLWRHAGRDLTADLKRCKDLLAALPRDGKPATLDHLERLALIDAVSGQGKEAMAAADEAIARFPATARAWRLRAEIRLDLGLEEGIAEDIKRGLDLAPGDPGLLELRALWNIRRNDPIQALKDLDGADQGGNRPQLAAIRGLAYGALKDWMKADQAWVRAITYDPYDPNNYIGAAEASIELGSTIRAHTRLDEAQQRTGGDPMIAARITELKNRCNQEATP